jgi:LysM repeat protein
VALAEDRDRRADAPDEGNRCYAEKAPRRRDLVHQSEYCYATQFASCSVFLGWAARSAAEPAYVSEAAQRAWGSGIAAPEGGAARSASGSGIGDGGHGVDGASTGTSLTGPGDDTDAFAMPTPEGGLFGPGDPAAATSRPASDLLDWVSASAWAEAPWDPNAEAEADDLESFDVEDPEAEPALDDDEPQAEEALQAPRVPAALPMRRRRPPQEPIRSRGSGEWHYADPPDREPLVRRRGSVAPPILMVVLGLLVVSLVAFLLPTLLGGDDRDRQAAMSSPSPGASARALATRAPERTAGPSPSPSATPEPEIRTYTVKPGDTLSGIAADPKVRANIRLLQCINGLANPNLLQPGQKLLIPPDGYSCPPGWRRTTPSASPSAAP